MKKIIAETKWSLVESENINGQNIFHKVNPPIFNKEPLLLNSISEKTSGLVPKILENKNDYEFSMFSAGCKTLREDFEFYKFIIGMENYAKIQVENINKDFGNILETTSSKTVNDSFNLLYSAYGYLFSEEVSINKEIIDLYIEAISGPISSLSHHDLHTGNMIKGETTVIIDWGESEITSPFLSFYAGLERNCLRHNLNESQKLVVERAYLAHFEGYIDNKVIDDLSSKSERLSGVFYAYTIGRLLRLYDKSNYHLLKNQIKYSVSCLSN